MSEGWHDWPLLGPGWKRRTAVRKSGQSCGSSDTYYQSPTGQRFRSKPELAKFLGESVDLSRFHFKNGTLISTEQKPTIKKKKKKNTAMGGVPVSPVTSQPSEQNESNLSRKQNGTNSMSTIVCCDGCKTWFTGVEFGRSKQAIWYCADCRASRRAHNKEQKLLKIAGCGKCSSCSLTEDCGSCSVCQLRFHNPNMGKSWKCVKRRCGKPILKPGDCGVCPGCTALEDCHACTICIKRQEKPETENRSCLKRRCQNKKPGPKPKVLKILTGKKLKLKTKWTLMSEQDGSCLPSKPKKWKSTSEQDEHSLPSYKLEQDGSSFSVKQKRKVGRRRNRKCGECEACQRKMDCGDCDFCQDKPKFGGRNLKRQKCRWRQCLRFAAEKNIPLNLKGSNHPVILERLKREKISEEEEKAANKQKVATLPEEPAIQLMPRLPVIKLERLDHRNGGYTSTDDSHGDWVIGKVQPKEVKQECVESVIEVQTIQEEPLDLHCPVKMGEFIVETDDLEEADESTPVITQIFSLGSMNANNRLDNILQEFLSELNEMPLPAHWEVVADSGPTLQLVQRSKASTMADTVVHIQPGLHFHVVVRDYTVPSSHQLYQNHPSRLTTVDEVVELICDLEAYRPCAGLPREGLLRSPKCEVLVYDERCPECILNPWPSGIGF